MRRAVRILYYGGLACLLLGFGACVTGSDDFSVTVIAIGIIAVFAGLLLNLVRKMFSDD